MDKKWPLGLIKRGPKSGSVKAGVDPTIVWWQEVEDEEEKQKHKGLGPAVTTTQAARDIGYEAYDMVPVSYAETIASAAETLLSCLPGEDQIKFADTEGAIEELRLRVEMYRSNVAPPNEDR